MSQNQTLRTGGISASRDYQDLPAWTKAMTLAERIYALSEDFPEREHTGLSAQMRLSVIQVASYIAAGSAKNNENGIIESYSQSQGAAAELMTQLALAARLGYIGSDNADALNKELDEVSRLLVGLKHGLKVAAKEAERAERDALKAAKEAAAAERPARREYADRGDRPRPAYKPREGGDERPARREYKSRDGGDAPRPYRARSEGAESKPYERKTYDKPRSDAGEGAPRTYRPRTEKSEAYGEKKPYGDRKPYGDKKAYGDKKPFGDKKPYGDRKPAGGKPFRKPRD